MLKEKPILMSWVELEVRPHIQPGAPISVVVVVKVASMKSADFVVPANTDSDQQLFREFHWAVRNIFRIRACVSRMAKQMPIRPIGNTTEINNLHLRANKKYAPLLRRLDTLAEQVRLVSSVRAVLSTPVITLYPLTPRPANFFLHESSLWTTEREISSEQLVDLVRARKKRDQQRLDASTAKKLQPRYISQTVRDQVWRRDKGQCVRCASRIRLEYDHIIPLSEGGGSTARNVELLCETCNRMKNNRIGG